MVDISRNEELISFVLFGLADIGLTELLLLALLPGPILEESFFRGMFIASFGSDHRFLPPP